MMSTIRTTRRWSRGGLLASLTITLALLASSVVRAEPVTAASTDAQPAARRRALPLTSEVRYQQVESFAIDDAGRPSVVWSAPIEIRVERGELVRIHKGERTVVADDVLACRARLTEQGRLLLDVVAPRDDDDGRPPVFEVRQIDLSPAR